MAAPKGQERETSMAMEAGFGMTLAYLVKLSSLLIDNMLATPSRILKENKDTQELRTRHGHS